MLAYARIQCRLCPRDDEPAALRVAEARDSFRDLGLPVALDSGKANDLAGVHGQRQPANRLDATVVARPDIVDLKHRGTRARRRLLDAEQHLAPHHEASEAGLARSFTGTVSISLPRRRTVMRSAISRTSFNLWVMKMIDMPSRLRLQDREELPCLLRSEDSRWLVENQDVGAAVERLQDLNPLLLSDGDVLDLRVGIDGEPELLRRMTPGGGRP